MRFHHWKVYSPRNRRQYWEFKCDCGSAKISDLQQVKGGGIRSCGCLQSEVRSQVHTKHGDGNPGEGNYRLYRIWLGMKDRCEQPTNPNHKRWGARGIKILWESYEAFRNDMLPTYTPGLTIERKDNDGNYCKENCVWIPRGDQARNRRDNVRLTYKGETLCQSQWAEKVGISPSLLHQRMHKLGWSLEKALTTPVQSH